MKDIQIESSVTILVQRSYKKITLKEKYQKSYRCFSCYRYDIDCKNRYLSPIRYEYDTYNIDIGDISRNFQYTPLYSTSTKMAARRDRGVSTFDFSLCLYCEALFS